MTGFLDTEIALAIKPTPQNKGQNVDTKYWLNGRDLQYPRWLLLPSFIQSFAVIIIIIIVEVITLGDIHF